MNRKTFLICLAVAGPSLWAKKKSKKKNKSNDDKKTNSTSEQALDGFFTLQSKDHDGAPDDYSFHSDGKFYFVSRSLHSKIIAKLDQQLKVYCTVVGTNKIIAIKYMR